MTLKKPLMIATLTAAVAMGAVSTRASAADPLLGALIGGGIGAAIGHQANHHNGAAVGGVLGAVIGSSVAASSNGYYERPYYGERYYAPAPVYGYGYAPYYAPVYGASIVYSSGPYYRGHGGYRHRRGW